MPGTGTGMRPKMGISMGYRELKNLYPLGARRNTCVLWLCFDSASAVLWLCFGCALAVLWLCFGSALTLL